MWEDIVVGVLTHFASVHRACPEGGPVSEGRSDLFRKKKLSSMTLTLITTSVAFLLLTSQVYVYMTLERGQTEYGVRERKGKKMTKFSNKHLGTGWGVGWGGGGGGEDAVYL